MKFSRRSKYFLRGMGFGILVTVVIFSVALVFYEPKNSSEAANDTAVSEEIKQEENTVEEKVEEKTEEKEEKNPEESEKNSSEETAETEDSSAKETSEETKSEENKSEETKPAETKITDTKTTETKTPSKTVSFKVTAGESSYKVAENLYRAGLIDDPNKFNTYLEQNGYDNTIHVGSFNIPEGSTYEQIANTISK